MILLVSSIRHLLLLSLCSIVVYYVELLLFVYLPSTSCSVIIIYDHFLFKIGRGQSVWTPHYAVLLT